MGNGTTSNTPQYTPQQVAPTQLTNIRAISCGDNFSMALTATGQVYVWGLNADGALGTGAAANTYQTTPTILGSLANVRQIEATERNSAALTTNGAVYVWGYNVNGELGLGHSNYTSTPALVGTFVGAASVALASGTTIVVRGDGSTVEWGFNNLGQLGTGSATPTFVPLPVAGPFLGPNTQLSGTNSQFMSIDRTGTVKTWGYGQTGLGYTPTTPGVDGGSCVPTTPTGVCLAVPPVASFPACALQRAYFQRPGATYEAHRHNNLQSPAEIGMYGTTTTIDASQAPYNGTVVFDGIYHLRGNVRFINGTFTLANFTKFYVDGASGQVGNFSSYNQTTIEVQSATLNLRATTLQANCPAQWGGIVLNGQAKIYTYAQGQRQQNRSVIRDAYRGIDSYTPDLNYPNTNQYYLYYTDFINNGTGLYDYVKGTALAGEGAHYCSFRDGDMGINLDPADTSPGNVFGGNYSNALFEFNTFDNLRWGIIGVPGQGRIVNNTFTNNYYCALATSGTSTSPLEIRNNTITVPSVWPAAVLAAQGVGVVPTSCGIQGMGQVMVKTNTISGADSNPTATSVVQVGLNWTGSCTVSDGNVFRNLDLGLTTSTDAYNGSTHTITGNTFAGNVTGLSFAQGSNYTGAPVSITLRCNTFSSSVPGAVGVWVKAGTVFPAALGGSNSPNGNNFSGISTASKRFVYDAALPTSGTPFQYYRYASSQEALGGSGTSIYKSDGSTLAPATVSTSSLSGVGACGTSSNTPGVYARPMTDGQSSNPSLPSNNLKASLTAAYPNPAHEILSFGFALPATGSGGRLVLRDLLGRAVATALLVGPEGQARLTVGHLPEGFYTGVLEVEGHIIATQKLSIKH